MNQSFWSRILTCVGAVASFGALAGGFLALAWLAVRLEGLPEVWLSPWHGGGQAPLVVVDAGHGGHDGGAVTNGLIEKHVALALAKHLRHHLEMQGIRVKMTRQTDAFLPLDARSGIANDFKAAAFVSLHLNTSVAAPEVIGIETYFARRKSPSLWAKLGAEPAEDNRGEHLAQCIQRHACRSAPAESRGVKEKPYAVVTHTACPAVLVECGFLTNAAEAARLNQPAYQARLAEGIAHGVAEFLKTHAVRPQRPPQSRPSNDLPPAPVTAAIEEP